MAGWWAWPLRWTAGHGEGRAQAEGWDAALALQGAVEGGGVEEEVVG